MLKDLLQVIYPRSCPGCGNSLVKQEKTICFSCLTDIQETGFERDADNNELYYRLAGKTPIAGAIALWFFDKQGKLQRIINALKYQNQPQVGKRLGAYYGARLKGSPFLQEVDVFLPVPLHKKRRESRGYNQAEQIALGLSKSTGIPLSTKEMIREQKTITQTQKGKSDRWESMKGAFKMKKPLSGNIVLVDDVITSGSTLEACIRCLYAQEIPPQSVKVLAIGMTRKKGHV